VIRQNDGAAPSGAPGAQASPPQDVGLIELFLLFSQLGLSSFGGGVSAWMHRTFVEQRGWLGEKEFAAALAFGRIMPGANVVNLAVLIGQRVRGAPGAAAAAMGLLVGPSFAVIGLAIVYRHFAGAIVLRAALEGTAVAAAGLLIGMGVTSGAHTVGPDAKFRGYVYGIGATAIMAVVFVLIGVFGFPTVPTVLCLAPLSMALAHFAGRNLSAEKPNDRG
jgi:chromate transporter